MKINLKFLLDFFTRFGKKKILIISIVLVALISILLSSAIFLSKKLKRGETEESKNHNEELSFDIDLYNSKKVTPAVIEFVDIAGLVKGASMG